MQLSAAWCHVAEWLDFSWFVRKGVVLEFTRFLRHASHAGSAHCARISVTNLRRLLRRQLILLRPQYGRHGFMRLAADAGTSFEEIHEAVDGMAIA